MKRVTNYDQMGFSSKYVAHPIHESEIINTELGNRINKKTYTIISTDSEKAFNKFQHLAIIKTCNKLYTERKFLNLINDI